jgi:CubicO group peptidase (beta-lactamase class C family)
VPNLKGLRGYAHRLFQGHLWLVIAVPFLSSVSGCASSWTDIRYLYRYFVWGSAQLISHVTDYERFPSHRIDNSPSAVRFIPAGATYSLPTTVEFKDGDEVRKVVLDDLLRSSGTHAFILIRDDRLLYEGYFNGYRRDSICHSMSVAKSFTSALVGIAIDDGFIKSVDDPIVEYLPELKGTGFDVVTIRHLLTMGSGVKFVSNFFPWDDEPLAYFHPDLRKLLLSHLRILEPPGRTFHYNSYNPELLGMILERVTHRTPSEYLQEKIWKPLGMEYPANWSIDSEEDGFELMQSAINARAIDFAKFGLLFLNRGNWNGKQIISASWVDESTSRDPNDRRRWESSFWETYSAWPEMGGYYKYFWWGLSRPAGDYSFSAIGKYGQFIFVSPRNKVVIVRTGRNSGIGEFLWPQVFHYIADSLS